MTSSKTPAQTPVAIAGAGLVGRLLAWRLLREGYPVTLLERGDFEGPGSAAHTAAAMISPMTEVVSSERGIYDMGMRSLQLWPEWLDELDRDAPTVAYSAAGSLVVAHPADAHELEQFHRDLQFHLGADNRAQWLTSREIATLEPDLDPRFQQALLLPDEAHLDNRALLRSLLHEIGRLGGRCLARTDVSFAPAQCQPELDLRQFALIFDCRGIGARQSLAKLRGVRGEVLWVETKEVHLNRPVRLMHPRYKLYVVPKPNHRFIIGATEIESDDRSPVSVQSTLELCSALYTLNPAFAEARMVETDTNLRPATWNNLPVIEPGAPLATDASAATVIAINGLYRHGYLLAPYLVDHVIDCLKNDKPMTL